MKIKKSVIFVFAAAAAFLLVQACGLSGSRLQKRTRFLMDTYVTIQVPGGKKELALIDKAMGRMEEVDKKFSMNDPGSILYKFNNQGTPVTDPEIIKIMKRAVRVSELSGGKFDVTVYPLMKLWGFYDEKRLPAEKEIREVLKNVNYKYLVIKDGKMTKAKKGVEVDIGGIAKLYAVEEGANVLKKAGVKNALIDAGGDIYAMGKHNGKDWKVGIRNPRGDGVIGALDVSDMLVTSSGDYERYFEKDGVRYHHLMDPHTGYPARGLSSVTIMCGDPETADGLSAAVFIMGMEKGFALAKKLGTFEVMAVAEDQQVFYSGGLKDSTRVVKVKNLPGTEKITGSK